MGSLAASKKVEYIFKMNWALQKSYVFIVGGWGAMILLPNLKKSSLVYKCSYPNFGKPSWPKYIFFYLGLVWFSAFI